MSSLKSKAVNRGREKNHPEGNWGSSRVKRREQLEKYARKALARNIDYDPKVRESKESRVVHPTPADVRYSTPTCYNCPYARCLKRQFKASSAIVLRGVGYLLIVRDNKAWWERHVLTRDGTANLKLYDRVFKQTRGKVRLFDLSPVEFKVPAPSQTVESATLRSEKYRQRAYQLEKQQREIKQGKRQPKPKIAVTPESFYRRQSLAEALANA